jgi:hypothetical protein
MFTQSSKKITAPLTTSNCANTTAGTRLVLFEQRIFGQNSVRNLYLIGHGLFWVLFLDEGFSFFFKSFMFLPNDSSKALAC